MYFWPGSWSGLNVKKELLWAQPVIETFERLGRAEVTQVAKD